MPQLSKFTENMRAMLPQWMKMAKDPNSVGAQFLEVFGLEFEDVEDYLNSVINNQYIETADIGQIDITYKVPLALPIILDMEKIDSVTATVDKKVHPFRLVHNLRNFYTINDENVAILDREEGLVYIRPVSSLMEGKLVYGPFNSIEINGASHSEYSLHHIWNTFDEFGLLLGIERLYGERNAAFKGRILDVFKKPGNSTKQGLINALSRELGIEGAEVKINEFGDKAFRGNLLNEDGSPSQKLLNYIERINKIFGFTWDNMAWGEGYWRSIEESQMGLEYLPHIWDASTINWKETDFQSGIGDGSDLKVTAPKEESNVRNFQYYVGVRGRNSGVERIDPELSFKYKITAEGQIMDEEYRPELYKYTIVAAEIIKVNYIIQAMKDYYYTTNIDFNASQNYVFDDNLDPSIEIVNGTTNLSKTSTEYKYYKIIADMRTNSKSSTPKLKSMTVKWRDSQGTLNDYTLDTQSDFSRNDVHVDTEIVNTLVTVDGNVELGFGEFYHMVDTEGSFKEGTHSSNVEILREGSVQLSLPKA